jgi:hypothetical protein
MNYSILIFFLVAYLCISPSEENKVIEQMKRVERSINRHEAYPFYSPDFQVPKFLNEALQVSGKTGESHFFFRVRQPCAHYCFLCMSKKFFNSRSLLIGEKDGR